jgi:tetraacyldisaccharide 4'-kinase
MRERTFAESLQRRVVAAWGERGAIAWMLWPLSLVFRAATALRRALFALGLLRTVRVGVPVVVVGNLVAGGAGKTPAVLAVVDLLRRSGYTPGIVSRGHGGSAASTQSVDVRPDSPAGVCGDEPLLLRRRSGAPVVVGADRPAAARTLLRLHPAVDIIVADDGLQHLRLQRDAQLIVFDERGGGNGFLLPAGPLREPIGRAAPRRSVIVYNAAEPTTPWPGGIARRELAGVATLADWWAGCAPDRELLARLRGRPLLAAAGMARPQRFFDMLRARGLQIEAELPLPDHHPFESLPWPSQTADVIVTEKDAVKLPPGTALGPARVWVATLDWRLPQDCEDALLCLLPAPPASHKET